MALRGSDVLCPARNFFSNLNVIDIGFVREVLPIPHRLPRSFPPTTSTSLPDTYVHIHNLHTYAKPHDLAKVLHALRDSTYAFEFEFMSLCRTSYPQFLSCCTELNRRTVVHRPGYSRSDKSSIQFMPSLASPSLATPTRVISLPLKVYYSVH